MAGQQRDIEWIVAEVMRRLLDLRAESEPTATNKPRETVAVKTKPPQKKPSPPPGQLRIDQRVITTALLDGRLDGVRQVVVPPRAVVTPAVRDALRKKRITIVNGTNQVETASVSTGYILGVVDSGGKFAAAAAAISGELGDITRLDNDCVIKAVRSVGHEVAAGRGAGVVITARPSVALCLANRQNGVRAAWAVSAAAVQEAMRHVGANLLIVDPTAHGVYELRVMAREFAKGNHACPQVYSQALDGEA
jgi:hypothetical protein